MKQGWLVNDFLTCIPGTKTFWHDLLENIPGLIDKTFPDFNELANHIENQLNRSSPDYIIRNASFFRSIFTKVPQICLLQDLVNIVEQINVCNSCKVTVVNSQFLANNFIGQITSQIKIIPMGVDFDFFDPNSKIEEYDINILPDSILYIGSSLNYPKGFDTVLELINNTNFNFTLVMKDDYYLEHNRVRVFNKIDHKKLKYIISKCRMAICTSLMETHHLAGVECCSMNKPLLTTSVGCYYKLKDDGWGAITTNNDFLNDIVKFYEYCDRYQPRIAMLNNKLDKNSCMNAWKNVISNV